MTMRTKPTLILATLVTSLFLAPALHAQEKSVPIKVKTVPDRDWNQYKKIAIGEFQGPDGEITQRSRDVSDGIAEVFMKESKKEGKKFKVYDRNQLANILKEQKTQLSGNFDEATTIKAGKLIGADLVITARVQFDDFFQQNSNVFLPLGRKGMMAPVTKGQYVLRVAFTLFNPETGETVDHFERGVQVDSKSAFGHSAVNEINDAPIKVEALKQLKETVTCDLAPCEVTETVKFTSDPSFNKELLAAIANFNIDEEEQAVAMIKAIHDRTDLKEVAQHKAQYNYGLILLAQGECQEAITLFKKAYLANSKSKLYLEAFNTAKQQCEGQERAARDTAK